MPSADEKTNDEMATTMLLVGLIPLALAYIASLNRTVRGWLLEHHVLVEPATSIWVLPFLDAGLDLVRLILLVALVILLVIVPAMLATRRRRATP